MDADVPTVHLATDVPAEAQQQNEVVVEAIGGAEVRRVLASGRYRLGSQRRSGGSRPQRLGEGDQLAGVVVEAAAMGDGDGHPLRGNRFTAGVGA